MYPSAKVADLNVDRKGMATFPMSLFRSPDYIAEGGHMQKQQAPADPGPSQSSHRRG